MERVRIPLHANHFAGIRDAKHKQATDGVGKSANRLAHCGEIASTPLEFCPKAFAVPDSFNYR